MTASTDSILAFLGKSTVAQTAKQIALATSLSESRVRELLPTFDGRIEKLEGRPATFRFAEGFALQAAIESVPEALAADESGSCPHCHAAPCDQTAAGPDGTFLGDSCNTCHQCGVVYNRFTSEIIPAGKATGRKAPMNPQPKIDAKTAFIEENGGTLVYSSRKWTVTKGTKTHTMSSLEFSQHSGTSLLALVK